MRKEMNIKLGGAKISETAILFPLSAVQIFMIINVNYFIIIIILLFLP